MSRYNEFGQLFFLLIALSCHRRVECHLFRTSMSCSGDQVLKDNPELPCDMVETIVETHNRLRQEVAAGKLPHQPGATNMRQMYWDDDLAKQAREWAKQCIYDHNKPVDEHNKYDGKIGQNLAEIGEELDASFDPQEEIDFEDAVLFWHAENKNYDWETRITTNSHEDVRHYTQLIWADTYMVGCGFSRFETSDASLRLYVCNYGPKGNYADTAPYTEGTKLSCPAGTVPSKRYKNLCDLESPPPTDRCGVNKNRRELPSLVNRRVTYGSDPNSISVGGINRRVQVLQRVVRKDDDNDYVIEGSSSNRRGQSPAIKSKERTVDQRNKKSWFPAHLMDIGERQLATKGFRFSRRNMQNGGQSEGKRSWSLGAWTQNKHKPVVTPESAPVPEGDDELFLQDPDQPVATDEIPERRRSENGKEGKGYGLPKREMENEDAEEQKNHRSWLRHQKKWNENDDDKRFIQDADKPIITYGIPPMPGGERSENGKEGRRYWSLGAWTQNKHKPVVTSESPPMPEGDDELFMQDPDQPVETDEIPEGRRSENGKEGRRYWSLGAWTQNKQKPVVTPESPPMPEGDDELFMQDPDQPVATDEIPEGRRNENGKEGKRYGLPKQEMENEDAEEQKNHRSWLRHQKKWNENDDDKRFIQDADKPIITYGIPPMPGGERSENGNDQSWSFRRTLSNQDLDETKEEGPSMPSHREASSCRRNSTAVTLREILSYLRNV